MQCSLALRTINIHDFCGVVGHFQVKLLLRATRSTIPGAAESLRNARTEGFRKLQRRRAMMFDFVRCECELLAAL